MSPVLKQLHYHSLLPGVLASWQLELGRAGGVGHLGVCPGAPVGGGQGEAGQHQGGGQAAPQQRRVEGVPGLEGRGRRAPLPRADRGRALAVQGVQGLGENREIPPTSPN